MIDVYALNGEDSIARGVAVVHRRWRIIGRRDSDGHRGEVGVVRAGAVSSFGHQRLAGLWCNTLSTSRIGKRLTGDGNELPVVAAWMQCQIQNTISIIVSNLTVWGNT